MDVKNSILPSASKKSYIFSGILNLLIRNNFLEKNSDVCRSTKFIFNDNVLEALSL